MDIKYNGFDYPLRENSRSDGEKWTKDKKNPEKEQLRIAGRALKMMRSIVFQSFKNLNSDFEDPAMEDRPTSRLDLLVKTRAHRLQVSPIQSQWLYKSKAYFGHLILSSLARLRDYLSTELMPDFPSPIV